MIAALVYALLLLPPLMRARFDPSVFILAGDHFVASDQTRTPIIVRPHSRGYDGQFYYAMALNPAAPARQAGGVTFDHPAWRWQRILYPAVSFALALGNAGLLPASMLGVNLICLAALGTLGGHAVRQWGAGGLPSWALMLWPGFMTSLTHDTTELLACACLLGAATAWLHGRLLIFTALAAGATLTRETSALMLAGMALASLALRPLRGTSATDRARPALAACAALVPAILWHLWLGQLWHGVAEAAPVSANLGLPFAGVAHRMAASLHDAIAAGLHGGSAVMPLYVLATALGILAFSAWVAASLPPLMRLGGKEAALGAGWLCMVALICLLSAGGPWIAPTAILRAYSECWVGGWLILVLSGARVRLAGGLALLPLALMNWQLCLLQLR